ncbi:MAG: hypothetical protein WDZ31_08625 [Phycisphaeraceae bacterium]
MGDRRRHRRPLDTREQMIAETEAFLSWALHGERPLPRIPRRRVDEGGYTSLLRQPGARAAVVHWWRRALNQVT